jgi:hypothetical protein
MILFRILDKVCTMLKLLENVQRSIVILLITSTLKVYKHVKEGPHDIQVTYLKSTGFHNSLLTTRRTTLGGLYNSIGGF